MTPGADFERLLPGIFVMKVYKIIKCARINFLEEFKNVAAGIADTVQRGLGTLPQQANLRRLNRRENQENEEPVQFALLASLILIFLKHFLNIAQTST